MAQESGTRATLALALLALSALAFGGDGKFEVSSERPIVTVPAIQNGYGAFSVDGKMALIIKGAPGTLL